ncbi:putative RNA-binding protein [Ceratocystis fimbriata CBS 114723]|uniref:Putative RNA-binding protein n=1 Tax=Ceratocystis fimbriata CBS 114723 TaxID=1035309 RepID=A0A2C5WVY4_9PEZI|nr:putative RNA-binding protein [Ceratocystis fimbriata CBS 114723]
MASNMDRSLDEILGEQRTRRNNSHNNQNNQRRNNSSNNFSHSRRRDNNDYPRDGVKKGYYRDEHRDLDSEWVHDRYEDNGRQSHNRRGRNNADLANHRFVNPLIQTTATRTKIELVSDARGCKIRVENLHYDLTEEEIKSLFVRIGPIARFQLRYDRAGRSDGVAYVTYESHADAKKAISEYDGANANGQPITLTILNNESKRNPFDSAVMPSRSLAERVSDPRDRSRSPRRNIADEDAVGLGIDRYIPGKGRSRSPVNRNRNQGRRPGARHEAVRNNNGRDGQRNRRDGSNNAGGNNRRPNKTQEELDAEMADYFGGPTEKPAETAPQATDVAPAAETTASADDVDMIE